MSIGGVSAYQRMQNWRASQANITNGQLGSLGTSLDFSFAFGNAATNNASGAASLAAQAALTRLQQQQAAKSNSSSTSPPTKASTADT